MKITYFSARGRVEPAQLMLEMAGVPYEFEAMTMEGWIAPGGKARALQHTPFGQLPMLEDGALTICQSRAILRYLARKLDMYGDTLGDKTRVDEVCETADELLIDFATLCWDPNFQERRAEHREATHKKLGLLESYFTRTRADAEHWVLPGRYTMADIIMAYTLETVMPLHPGLLQEFPQLEHFMTAFFTADRVREYVRSDRRTRTWTVPIAQFGGKPEETHHWTD